MYEELNSSDSAATPSELSPSERVNAFTNTQFGTVRTIISDKDEMFFVGRNICKALSYNEPHKAIAQHVNHKDGMKCPILSKGSMQDTWVINESGLYALLPIAERGELNASSN